MMIHLENKSNFFSSLENQWIQYSLDVLDWLHGRPPARSAGEQVSMRNCLHPLTVLLGWSLGQHSSPTWMFLWHRGPLQSEAMQQEYHDLLQPGSEAPSSNSHQLAMWLPVPCPGHIQPLLCPDLYPHYFLFVFPLCLWPLLLLSLDPSLSQDSWIALFIYHCSYFGFKSHPQLGDGREMEGVGVDATMSAW